MSLDLDNFRQLPRVKFHSPDTEPRGVAGRLSRVPRCVRITLQGISRANLSRWRKILLRPKPTPVEAGFSPARNGRMGQMIFPGIIARRSCLMNTVIITGAAGLIGSESVKRFAREGFKVVGH